jgi:c-di-GMP-binding flagellar brake protein YcgR
MEERRKAPRIQEDSEVTITIAAKGSGFPEETVIHNRGKDISTSGIRIKSNIILPIDTLLMMDIKLKYLQQKIGAMGKIKWIKIIVEDESYELGVQFVSSPREARQKLAEYIFWKLKKIENA